MNWKNIDIDHVNAIILFKISDEEKLKESFNWRITQPLVKEVHQQKRVKVYLLEYRLQFIKAHQFLKL